MATWKVNRSDLHLAVIRELRRQGVDANGSGELSCEQLAKITRACDQIVDAVQQEGDQHDR